MKYDIKELIESTGVDECKKIPWIKYILGFILILEMMITFWFISKNPDHLFLTIFLFILVVIVTIFVGGLISIKYSMNQHVKTFIGPMNVMVDEYKQYHNAEKLLMNLLSLKDKTPGKDAWAIWKLNVVYALTEFKRYEDADAVLESIDATKADLIEQIDIHRQKIEEGRTS